MRVAQHFDAIDVGHFDVGDDHVVESAFEFPLGILSGFYGLDLVAFAAQGNIQHLADGALVVANQNVTHALYLLCPPPPLPRPRKGALVSPPAVSPMGLPLPPGGAAEGQRRYPLRLWSAPKPCLRGPARSDRRWPNPGRCRLRTVTGTVRRSFPPTAGSCPDPYRRS